MTLKGRFKTIVAGAALVTLGLGSTPLLQGSTTFRRSRQHTRHRLRPLRPAVSHGLGRVAFDAGGDPPEVSIGERLFLETRFAQFFAAHDRGDVNRPLASGDPVMDSTRTTGAPLPGAFAGQSINCRSCHFVDDVASFPGGSVRTYADFARKSPLPERDDRRLETPRNSPPLVNAFLPRQKGLLLHFDGEFASTEDLVKGTLTGRNFGWLAFERPAAVAHIARVIRQDDGSDDLGQAYDGVPYRELLLGNDPRISPDLQLPAQFQLDVANASDEAVLDAVARLVAAYNESLVFAQDADGFFNGSPYDAFLAKNDLPRAPDPDEPDADYAARLRTAVLGLGAPLYVGPGDGSFALRAQRFVFGQDELTGLRLFLAQDGGPQAGAGNCVACHVPPTFSDFRFHNTGASQEEYDAVHGGGAFAALAIPQLAERNARPELYLPPSPRLPTAAGRFRAAAASDSPGQTDLGLWNIWANPDVPAPQSTIAGTLGVEGQAPGDVLPRTIALFKTPGLRDLGQSAPYLHSGRMDSLEDVVRFYIAFSQKARLARVRNASPDLARIFLTEEAVAPLAAFLRSLNEDYQ